jgi:hypothetical protein
MWHVWERGEVLTGFWWGDLKKKDNVQNLVIVGSLILKCIFKMWDRDMD